MEENKGIKISLSTFFLIIAIIIIILMGLYIYKVNVEKNTEMKKTADLELEVSNLNNTITNLQEKINTISETINSSSSNENTNNQVLEEANITDYINKTGLVGKTTYEINNSATKHLNGFDIILEDSKVYFKLTNKGNIESYSITSSTINRKENIKEEITGFSGKVKNVYFYEVGQAVMPESLAILFLMEDGRIEYISYVDALQTTNLSSRGEIKGLYNITEIYFASACEWADETGGSGWASCVAKDSNNQYYSLEIALEKNNINLSKVK